MSLSLTTIPEDEVERLYRIETLAMGYKRVMEDSDMPDAEWEARQRETQQLLFEALG
jgi:hypothetical protein